MLNSKAEKNPRTSKPLIIEDASKIIKALITNVNKPNVKRFMGKVKRIKIGFKVTFTIPKNIASQKAGQNPPILIPGINKAVNRIANVNINHLKIIYI